ncbi:zinc finger protein 37-like isoform X2 [Corythoichthys intestinalis]|nr:zinc finger protein 37-like isoform X2 [Corythoichthys intestinalis]XP_057692604.1 zinc finger protein 37-like isoform X2 [Corythoichthys intestinalis]
MPFIKQEAEPETPSMKEEKQEDEIPNFPMTVSVKIEEQGPSDSSFEHSTTKDITMQDLHPEDHDPPHVKQESESEMPYIKQEAQLETLYMIEKQQQDEITKFPMNASVKSEEDEGPGEESRSAKTLDDRLFQHLTAKGEGRPQPSGPLALLSESDDVTSHSSDFNSDEEDVDFDQNVSKFSNKSSLKRRTKEHVDITVQDLHPETHDLPHVKQESASEMLCIKQEAEPEILYMIEKDQQDEIPKFPINLSVKSEEDDVPSEDSSDRLFQHLTAKREGRSQPGGLLAPLSDSDNITSHSSDEDVDVHQDVSKFSNKSSLKKKTKEHVDMTEDLHLEKHDVIQESQSEMLYIKQDAEPETPSMKKEELEDEIPKFPMTVRVKTEEECQSDSSFKHLKTEDITVRDLHPERHDLPHVKQESESEMLCIKQEAEPETLYVIEKEQKDESPKFPIIASVKSEEDEGPGKESRSAKTLNDHLFQHLTAKGEGRPPPSSPLALLSDSDDVTSHSSDFNSDEEDVDFNQNVSKFSNKSSLKRETNEHVDRKRFACSLCDKRVSTKQAVTRHMRTHTGEKPFVCTCCDKRFHMKHELTRHMRTHTRESPFACRLCDIGFFTKQELTRHRLTCIEEKPFSCSLCDKRYSEKSKLNQHVKSHTGEKPCVCTGCGKRFRCKQELTKHTRTHTGEKPFACPVCDKRFNEKGNLNAHTRMHTGEKPFDCSLCDKRYCKKQDLTRHMNTHTGEKPFACSDCGKRFTWKRYLTKHTKTHTTEKPFS